MNYYDYKQVNGEIAFLAGSMNELALDLSDYIIPDNCLEVDVFKIENNFSTFNNILRERLIKYNNKDINIESIDLNIEKKDVVDYSIFVSDYFKKHAEKNFLEGVNYFLERISSDIGKPVCIHIPKLLNDNTIIAMEKAYCLTMIFKYLFIEYENFVILLMIGTTN